jgi:D-arabinose 1-dehydrogenase
LDQISKCGRYGPNKQDFDYSPATIRRSLLRTLGRLGTEYLDVFYLHDVEFIASRPSPSLPSADACAAITQEHDRELWGLGPGDEGKIWGEGDRVILTAYRELRTLRQEGLVCSIGITGKPFMERSLTSNRQAGYPLAVLLRLALLIRSHFNEPVDALLSYSHYTLQNDAFREYVPHFTGAGVKQLYCASPLNMGFFSPTVPKWHPAPLDMLEARQQAIKFVQSSDWTGGVPDLALGFALRRGPPGGTDGNPLLFSIPTVVGFSNLKEVHHAVRVWHDVNHPESEGDDGRRVLLENRIMKYFAEAGWSNWSWESGN